MNWLIFTIVAALLNALMDIFIKLSSGKISSSLGGAILTFSASIVMMVAFVYELLSKNKTEISSLGVVYSVLAGLSVGIATWCIFKMFSMGANISVAIPVLRIGIILITTLFGIFVLKESFSFKLIIGFALSLTGLFLIVS